MDSGERRLRKHDNKMQCMILLGIWLGKKEFYEGLCWENV
jgi:hypothetical protein